MGHPVLLYDGVCGLCNSTVRFVLRRDRAAIFRFAALQSPWAERVLAEHGARASDLDTFYVVVDEQLLARSDAVLFLLRQFGGIWPTIGWVLRLLPRFVRDWLYRIVARNRYRIFGRYETCRLPGADERARFLG
jgi:predicted DCC family thiol-disulfide oxidoreductase YuxK